MNCAKNDIKTIRSSLYVISLFLYAALTTISCSKNEGLVYTTGDWNTDSLGYHRIEIKVNNDADAVFAEIPWKRRDKNPQNKLVRIFFKYPEIEVTNIFPIAVTNEVGKFVFQPLAGKGTYYMYYLPGTMQGRSNYPRVNYPAANYGTDNAWIDLHNLSDSLSVSMIPSVNVVSIQSSDRFNSFFPMETIATGSEINNLINSYPDNKFLLFPESRFNSIRMTDYIPLKWIDEGPFGKVSGKPMRGEFFSFQVGIYSHTNDLNNIKVSFSDIRNRGGEVVIPAGDLQSFNTQGNGWDGRPFLKNMKVPAGKVQALWCGMMIPEGFDGGMLRGSVTIEPEGLKAETLDINLKVGKELIKDHGDDDPSRMTRMRWFNSKLAFDDEVVDPFIPVSLENGIVRILGRELEIGANGLPRRYYSYFNNNNTAIGDVASSVLAGQFSFEMIRANGSVIYLRNEGSQFNTVGPGKIEWSNLSENNEVSLDTDGILEFDGFVSLRISVSAKRELDLSNIRLKIPLKKEFATYMMGLGLKGGNRPYYHGWKWNRMNHQEGAWIGGVNGGVQFALRDDNYERPLNTNFYREKPLVMPEGWYNEGKGGINISTLENSVEVLCYSGSRIMQPGEEAVFTINLLLTPFKPIDTDLQWATRFYHRYEPLDTILAYGANTVNVHHATEINPWINYPFLEQEKMRSYIDGAHSKGMKVKIYNTVRELSNRAPEIFAIRSFGHEIFSSGPGNGFNWLQEHLGDDYIAAWFVPLLKDAAIINSGMSRWHNYYIEGMDWLAREMEIDGLYIDDVAFDRTTMKRLRKVLDRNRDGALIDLHSANQYNVRDGFTNSANLYMEHFPYINRLWFGEYFDKDLPPDFWLVEMSGIPFGLMGEMLQDGGNQYRGLLYGMTSRAPWSGDPRNIWELWDSIGIEGCEFIGYWDENCPATTGYRSIPASVYMKDGKAMVAIASWSDETRNIWLRVDWEKLGFSPSDAVFRVPYVREFQKEASYRPWETIPVEPGKGIVIIIEPGK
ncbi:MAG TPA: glycoside hydrolase domain-containing protein [Bacteroidales bacterium]|nr:glycoside hydrolase domain-containing protein [Bacteroidales bacterium]